MAEAALEANPHHGAGSFLLRGDLDAASVPALLAAGERFDAVVGDGGEITVDLSAVGNSDSAGVALLVEWLRRCHAGGGALHVHGVPAQMHAIIRVAALEQLFELDAESVPESIPESNNPY